MEKWDGCRLVQLRLFKNRIYKYFIKVFKKYVGCSPVKFMESGGAGPTP